MSAQPAPTPYMLPEPERWLTAEEVLRATGRSAEWLRQKAQTGAILSREAAKRAPNGRPIREYLAASLPEDAAPDPDRPEAEPKTALALSPLFAGTALAPRRVALPSPEAQAQAEARLAVLQPLMEYSADPGRFASLRLADGRAVTTRAAMVTYLAETNGVSERTLHTWLARYRQGGFPALARAQRSDKRSSRFFTEHVKAAHLAAYLYLECRQSFRVVHEAIAEDREMLGVAEAALPSYETVRAFLSGLPPYLKAYAREGRRAYQERMSPYLRRGYDDVRANELWVSDHMIHDVEVMNDCFPEAEWGAPIRLRFTCLLDFRARYVVGASWCWEGSSRSIATALRHAVTNHGVAEGIYCDNGKDYKRVAKGAMPAYLDESPLARERWYETEIRNLADMGVFARLHMKVTHCIVRHPQSKHVERFFRTLHEQFDKLWHQHYTGGAPHLRPDATTAAMEMHRKLLKHGQAGTSMHPPASVFISLCRSWIDEQYHRRAHDGEGMDGRSPAEVFAAERDPDQRPAPQPHDLALMLAEQTVRKVRECAIELTIVPGQPRRYTYCDAVSRDILHDLNEREVTVAYDLNDTESVAILDQGGHFLTWARAEALIGFAPEDPQVQQRIGDSMADRRHLEKATRNLIGGIAKVARANGALAPVERLSCQVPASSSPSSPASPINDLLTHRAPKPRPVALPQEQLTPAQAARLLVEGIRK